jgi:hypothetical protein
VYNTEQAFLLNIRLYIAQYMDVKSLDSVPRSRGHPVVFVDKPAINKTLLLPWGGEGRLGRRWCRGGEGHDADALLWLNRRRRQQIDKPRSADLPVD